MKEYKNNVELVEYLMSKGVKISNKEQALNKIKLYSYYNIVNTYKDVFKNDDGSYKENVSFEEIYSLFEFDKNIRNIFLKYLLEIEMILKTYLSETIASRYGIRNYLLKENFDDSLSENNIINSMNLINEEIIKQNGKHDAVTHYMSNYGFVPPFVLTKILTFGELSRLYGMLKQSDRQNISKNFKLSDKVLKQIIINMTMVRNICAHNDRLFSFHSKFRISFKYIDKDYNSSSVNIYMIMKSIELMLPKDKKRDFNRQINSEIKKLNNSLKTIKINEILNLMGIYRNKKASNEI